MEEKNVAGPVAACNLTVHCVCVCMCVFDGVMQPDKFVYKSIFESFVYLLGVVCMFNCLFLNDFYVCFFFVVYH